MLLYATVESERGKTVSKSGNEYISIKIQNKNRECPLSFEIRPRPNSEENYFDVVVHYNRKVIPEGIKRIPWDR